MKSSRTLLLVGLSMLLTTVMTRAETIQEAYLKASNAGAEDHFGRSVAMDGDTLVIGAYGEASNGTSTGNNTMADAGAVYVFVRDGGGWTQQAYLKAASRAGTTASPASKAHPERSPMPNWPPKSPPPRCIQALFRHLA